MAFSLAPRSDLGVLAALYAHAGAVSVPSLLPPEQAAALAHELAATELWLEIFRAGEKVYEMPRAQFLALSSSQKDELRRMVEDAARGGLQYRYRAIRVSEDREVRASRGLELDRFADLLNAPETLDLLRTITGSPSIALADAQATDYRAGDFLTTHDDEVSGKHRLAAYVYSLTGEWQADWGGLLLFEEGEAVSGFVPEYNVLRLFSVPRRHHVSYVAPWADGRRVSVTGWLRGAAPGGPVQTGA